MKQVVRPFLLTGSLHARLQIPSVEYRLSYLVMSIFCGELRGIEIFDVKTNYKQVFNKRTRDALSEGQVLAQSLPSEVEIEYMAKSE